MRRIRELGERRWRDTVVAALDRAIARGDLPPDADAELIVDIWSGAIGYRRAFRRGPLGADFGGVLLDMVMSGMAPVRWAGSYEGWAVDFTPDPLREALEWLTKIPVGQILRIGDDVPPFLRADRVLVLHGDEAWAAPLEEEFPRERTSRRFETMARRGPHWPSGDPVDIIVRLRGESTIRRLIRLPDQPIERTV